MIDDAHVTLREVTALRGSRQVGTGAFEVSLDRVRRLPGRIAYDPVELWLVDDLPAARRLLAGLRDRGTIGGRTSLAIRRPRHPVEVVGLATFLAAP